MDEKYISVTKFKESLTKLIVEGGTEATRTAIVRTLNKIVPELLDDEPSADVQPIVHAYWIELSNALNLNENPCKCSNCGHILSFMNHYPKSKYCDECGAKMDVIFQDDKVRAIKVTGWENDENG